MIGALYSGLTGLRTHQAKVNIIGNNLANINTTGFKKSRVIFRETFAQTLKGGVAATGQRGATNPNQVGAGVQISSIDVNHKNGSPQITDVATDLMVRGKGMFVLGAPDAAQVDPNSKGVAASSNSVKVFTRAGNFGIDTNGDMMYRPNGYRVMGWNADSATGLVDSSKPVGRINFPFSKSIAKSTGFVEYMGNLDTRAGQAELTEGGGTGIKTYDLPADSQLSTGAHRIIVKRDPADPESGNLVASLDGGPDVAIPGADQAVTLQDPSGNGITLSFGENLNSGIASINVVSAVHKSTIGVYDGVGQRHDVELTFTKQKDTDNTWTWAATGATDVEADGVSGSGLVRFNGDSGAFEFVTPAEPTVTIKPKGDGKDLTFDLQFGNLTQFASTSDAMASRQDGVGPGTLTSFSIGADGTINGIFSNGISRSIAQVALADIPNPEGLNTIQDSMFAVSPSSGAPSYIAAGGRNMGEISSGALEMSNVDLTEEFTDLITTERGFQANSRIITTSDSILQEALGLKR